MGVLLIVIFNSIVNKRVWTDKITIFNYCDEQLIVQQISFNFP